MKHPIAGACCLGFAVLLGAFSGCQSSPRSLDQVVQFEPAPRASVGQHQELAPVDGRSVTELLREADRAFQLANEAQQQGDSEASVRYYSQMLQLLQAANLDPGIFYSVREEFGKVLDESARRANVYVQHQPRHVHSGGALGGTGALHIPLPLPRRVIEEIEEIQRSYPRSFQIGLDRSHRYVPWIQEQLRQAGMPEELAYLAMVESQYNVKINSPAGAGGMWQFMRATGQRFDLRIDSHVDERYNWQSASLAAIRYLQALNQFFDGNWPLAISAYNMGEYGLERAIASNGGERDFWRLIEEGPAADRIKTETKKFYPRFLATCIVASNPERYGFKSNPQPVEEVVRVPVRGVYALNDLEKAMQLPQGALVKLNPDLINEITPPSGDYFVSVPPVHRESLLAALNTVPQVSPKTAPRRSTPQQPQAPGVVLATHRVARGETISSIARKYKVSNDALMQANSLRNARALRTGQNLRIPGQSAPAPQPELARAAEPNRPSVRQGSTTYTVQRGDTLSGIAERHKVTVANLREWNNLSARAHIHPGAKITIHGQAAGAGVTASTAAPERVHLVQQGEYASRIAQQYGVPLDDLLAWNNKTKNDTLRIGERLIIRGGQSGPALEAAVAAAAGEPELAQSQSAPEQIHEVRRGEYASKIAQQYGVPLDSLLSWNNLGKDPMLKVGDKLVIRGGKAVPNTQTAQVPQSDRLILANTAGAERIHEVQPGEYPGKIAQQYGVSVEELLGWNMLDRNATIRVGDKLVLRNAPKAAGGPAPVPATAKASATTTYTVQPGDTPIKIAKAHGMSVDDLLKGNNLTRDSMLRIGQKLSVNGAMAQAAQAAAPPAARQAAAQPATVKHKVGKGETAGAIASKYNVRTADLLRWNNLKADSVLHIGQELTVHPEADMKTAAATPASAPSQQIKHVVEAGHNPTVIARRYGVGVRDLYQWNGWSDSHVLHIGDEVVILKP